MYDFRQVVKKSECICSWSVPWFVKTFAHVMFIRCVLPNSKHQLVLTRILYVLGATCKGYSYVMTYVYMRRRNLDMHSAHSCDWSASCIYHKWHVKCDLVVVNEFPIHAPMLAYMCCYFGACHHTHVDISAPNTA